MRENNIEMWSNDKNDETGVTTVNGAASTVFL